MNKKQSKISASLMCADPFNLKNIIETLEENKVDYLHIDVMDGKFVPNLGIGSDYITALKKHTKIPFDYHIMVQEPDSIIPLLQIASEDIVSIHYESTFQVQRTLENIKKYGAKVFLAINPATPLHIMDELVYFIDGINMLMVNPGFAGQKAVKPSFVKAEKLASFLAENKCEHLDVEVDGNISFENASLLKNAGANIFVAGTSSIFGKEDLSVSIQNLRKAIS